MSLHMYKVQARSWNKNFTDKFGDQYSMHLLSDTDIINLMMDQNFGRASIDRQVVGESVIRVLEFQNDYD